MNVRGIRTSIAAATLAAWALLVVNVTPWVWLPDDVRALLMAVAMTGTLSWAIRAASRPIGEIYELGFEAGRRAAKLETVFEDARVIPFPRRRQAR